MAEPDESVGNMTPVAPSQPALLALLDLSGLPALMPGTPPERPAPPAAVASPTSTPAPEVAQRSAVAVEDDPPGLRFSPYVGPHRLRAAVALIAASVVLGALLATVIGVAAAFTVAAVNHAVSAGP